MCCTYTKEKKNIKKRRKKKKPPLFQNKVAGQVGELFGDDVVVSEFFLISVDVLDIDGHSGRFG